MSHVTIQMPFQQKKPMCSGYFFCKKITSIGKECPINGQNMIEHRCFFFFFTAKCKSALLTNKLQMPF